MKSLIAAAIVASSLCSGHAADAEWLATTTGPDVFGNTTVVATGVERLTDSLIVQCDQKNQLEIAYVIRTSDTTVGDAQMGGQLLIQTASGTPPKKLDSKLQQWNDNYIGFVASGRTPTIVAAVRAIGEATGEINIGIAVGGHQFQASFSSSGSTAAIATVVKDCKLNEIAPDAPEPSIG